MTGRSGRPPTGCGLPPGCDPVHPRPVDPGLLAAAPQRQRTRRAPLGAPGSPRLAGDDHPAAGDHAGRRASRGLRRVPRTQGPVRLRARHRGQALAQRDLRLLAVPLAASRPVTAVPRITVPVLDQIARHDGMPSAGEVDKAIPRTPRAEAQRFPIDHFGPFSLEHHPTIATDASDFLRPPRDISCTLRVTGTRAGPWRLPGYQGCRRLPCSDLPGRLWRLASRARDVPAERRRHRGRTIAAITDRTQNRIICAPAPHLRPSI